MSKRILGIVISLSVAGSFCITAAYYAHFFYARYRQTQTEFAQEMGPRLLGVEARVGKLESHNPRYLIPTRVRGAISTTDLNPFDAWARLHRSLTQSQEYQILENSNGLWIVPELRLPAGSTNQHRFDIHVGSGIGSVADGWLSLTEPYGELASFEQLSLYRRGTNVLQLGALAKRGASIRMEFTAVILLER